MMEFVEASGVGDVNKHHRRSVNKTTGSDRSRKGVFHWCVRARSTRSALLFRGVSLFCRNLLGERRDEKQRHAYRLTCNRTE